jgi:hypothetical protein
MYLYALRARARWLSQQQQQDQQVLLYLYYLLVDDHQVYSST